MRTRCVTALVAAVLVMLFSSAPAGAATPRGTPCPGTFRVLHDDHIGRLVLPAGPYVIRVLNPSRLSCASASDLFRQFLEDFDGRLPRPWILDVATATFTRGPGSDVGFNVTRSSGTGGGGGQHPATGTSCPAFFRVLHNDRIGPLRLRAGNYRITLLSVGRLSCARAAADFARFLLDFDGRLPRPWFLDPETGTFMRGSRNVGFRVKSAVGRPTNPSRGGRFPRAGERVCPGSFRVLHRDRVGRLILPAGPYLVTLLPGRGMSCGRASRLFTAFLNLPSGRLPRPWVVVSASGTFTRGRHSNVGFRVKQLRPRT